VKITALGFRIHVDGAERDPVLQSFILRELSRYKNVSACFDEGELIVTVESHATTRKAVSSRAAEVFDSLSKILSSARKKYDEYLRIRDLLESATYSVSAALEGIPAIEGD